MYVYTELSFGNYSFARILKILFPESWKDRESKYEQYCVCSSEEIHREWSMINRSVWQHVTRTLYRIEYRQARRIQWTRRKRATRSFLPAVAFWNESRLTVVPRTYKRSTKRRRSESQGDRQSQRNVIESWTRFTSAFHEKIDTSRCVTFIALRSVLMLEFLIGISVKLVLSVHFTIKLVKFNGQVNVKGKKKCNIYNNITNRFTDVTDVTFFS